MTTQFDPSAAASENSGIFGLPHTEEEAALIYLPIGWDAATSYGGGASAGPAAILAASRQVDLYDLDIEKPYSPGLHLLPASEKIAQWNKEGRVLLREIHEGNGQPGREKAVANARENANALGDRLNEFVYQEAKRVLNSGKILAFIGGDHSSVFGGIKAVGEMFPQFGILHIDAHFDFRQAYEGLTWSHASIMYNVLENVPSVKKMVQVGIRDVSEEEVKYGRSQKDRVVTHFDRDLARKKMEGVSWAQICQEIVAPLPDLVYISFDVDGLDPSFCPHTGTPVPGGISFQEVNYLIAAVVRSGRKIIGFDLNEVAPNLRDEEDEWDANVGARLLYKLSGWTLASQGKVAIF